MDDRRAPDAAQGTALPLRTLLVQPDAGRAPVEALLDAARRQIALKMFSLTDEALLAALERAVRRGVAVRIILNRTRTDGSHDNDGSFARLAAVGAEVRWSSPHFSASHEKSVMVDGERCLVSSFNWGDKYFTETRDYGLVTSDPGEVAEIAACFEADWTDRPFQPAPDSRLLWAPGVARRQVAALIGEARETIHLQHALLADATVLLRLTEAAARGVRVRFLCAGGRGLRMWDRPETFASLRILHNAGGRVRRIRTPKMHGNLTIVDNATAQFGSLHFQHGAFDTRRDLSIEIDEPALLAVLAERFRADWHEAEHYLPHDPIEHGDTDPLDRDVWRT